MYAALQRVLAGACAFVLTYLVVAFVAASRIARYLTPDSGNGPTVLDAYRAAGEPLWQAIGWLALNTLGVPIGVSVESGYVIRHANLVYDGSLWFGVVPGVFGLVPMVTCILAGAGVVVLSPTPSHVPLAVGTYMIPGHLSAVLVATILFSGAVGPVEASFTLTTLYPPTKWLIPTVVSPLLFGSAGAFVVQSPFVQSILNRLRTVSTGR
ncbi:hypothetical protein GRX01_03525 [Halobaculum sp. WSA2]|uniref:Uncharacterized protein n=1 Tax=Halobaculum saliterrae TaxID=2073113 RepID=A0A6B0SNX3_9EURY|nr:hypothetical protein [Halobaculum saliterrae]MXR40425.1 hypothetical protein [Halobaculum saliterrae]